MKIRDIEIGKKYVKSLPGKPSHDVLVIDKKDNNTGITIKYISEGASKGLVMDSNEIAVERYIYRHFNEQYDIPKPKWED